MESTLAKKFGEIIKRERGELEMTQEMLAVNSGLHKNYISFLERGMRQPSLETIFVLSEALGMQPDELIRMVQDE